MYIETFYWREFAASKISPYICKLFCGEETKKQVNLITKEID